MYFMGFLFFLIVGGIVCLSCVVGGMNMMPWHCHTFSKMTQEERKNYWRGFRIAVLPLFIYCLLVFAYLAPVFKL